MIYIAMPDGKHRDEVAKTLRGAGYDLSVFTRTGDCFFAIGARPPKLLLLGGSLSDANPLDFLRHLRSDARTAALPVVMVSPAYTPNECVAALDGGADDYLGGGFDVGEMLSRVRLALRRSTLPHRSTLEFEGIMLDDDRRRVLVDGKPFSLTYTEYEILKLLLRDPGEVLTRSRILERVWGTSSVGETRAVDMHIAALRRKLGRHGSLIQTMRGTGYMLTRGVS